MNDVMAFDGEAVRSVIVFGQHVDIWLQPVESEVRRRSQSDAGKLSHDVIRGLMTLPEGMPIRFETISADMLLVLEEAIETGAVRLANQRIVRIAIPAVTLNGIVKTINTWDDIRALTLLRTHAPRLAIASAPIARRILKEIDHDVGVALRQGHGIRILREPGSRWVRPTWRRWVTAEAAFERWRSEAAIAEL